MSLQLKPYPEYKESGVTWLGKIPSNWHVLPNRAVFNEIAERNHPREHLLSVTISRGVIQQKDLLKKTAKKDTSNEDKSNYKLVCPQDLAYNKMRAWQGAIGVSDHRGIVSPAYIVIRPKIRCNPGYFNYLFRTPMFAKEAERWSYGITSDQWSLRAEDCMRICCAVPPIAEQDRIVSVLKHFEHHVRHLIRSKRRLIELLNEQKQAIIHQAVTRGLDPNVRLKQSGIDWLAEMPEKWVSVRLRNLALSLKTGPFGSQLHSSDYVTNGTPLINPVHMKDGKIIADPHCAIGPAKAKELAEHRLDSGDIVFARRGELGRCVRVSEVESGWFCGTGSIRLRLKEKSPQSEYLVMLLRSKGIAQWLSAQSVGATMENLSTAILSKLPLPLPPTTEQKAIQDFVNKHEKTIDRAIESVCRQIELLREYRTRVIADVVTGKLDVRGVKLDEAIDTTDILEYFEENEAEIDSDKEIDAIEGLDE